MNLPTALRHLTAAGITSDVLTAEHVDPTDPAVLRVFVDDKILAITDGDSVVAGYRELGALTAAREALLPDDERAWRDAFAARLRADLEADLPACVRAA